MAQNEIKFTVKVADDGSLSLVAKNADKAAKSVDGVTKSTKRQKQAVDNANKSNDRYNKGQKGVAGATSNSTKAFSKQRNAISGSSGLVAAYATIAANIFALTAAFGALQRAAQVEKLQKGLVELGKSSGLAMNTLAKGLQEATGNAISLEEAMRSTATVISAGIDPANLNRFGEAAKNISAALGRDVTDSFNRLTRGVTKLEPELLDELGLFIRVDEASADYAATLGKNADELTNFEKRIAFQNAALEQAEEKFGTLSDSVDIDAFSKLSASLSDLSNNVLGEVAKRIEPIVTLLAQNPLALVGVIAALGGRQIASALSNLIDLEKGLENNTKKLRKLGKDAGSTAAGLNGTSKGIGNLAGKIQNGTAKLKDYNTGFGAIKKSGTAYRSMLERGAITQEQYNAGIARGRLITIQFAKAQKSQFSAMGKTSLSLALAAFQAGRFKLAFKLAERATKRFKVAAKAAGLELRTLGASGQYGALGLTLLSNAGKVAAFSIKFLGKAILGALNIIGLIIVAVQILGEAWTWLSNKFKTKEELALKERLEELQETNKELAENLRESSLAFENQSSKIKGLGNAYSASYNALSTWQAEFKKTQNLGGKAFTPTQALQQYNVALGSSTRLQQTLTRLTGSDETITNVNQLNGSTQERVDILAKAVEMTKNEDQAITNLVNTVREGAQAAQEFMAGLVPETPIDSMVDSVTAISTALAQAQEQAEASGAEISSILAETVTSEQAQLFNFPKEAIDDAKNELAEIDRQIEKLATKEADIKTVGSRKDGDRRQVSAITAAEKKQLGVLRAQRREKQAILKVALKEGDKQTENVGTLGKALIAQQKQLRFGALKVEEAENELKLLQENGDLSVENLKAIIAKEEEIRKAKLDNVSIELTANKALIEGMEEGVAKEALQERINVLTAEQNVLQENGTRTQETALRRLDQELSNLKAKQDFEKAILDFQEKQLKARESILRTQRSTLELENSAKAARQGRSVTAQERVAVLTNKESGEIALKNLEDDKLATRMKGIEMEFALAKVQFDLLKTRINLAKESGVISETEQTSLIAEVDAQIGTLDVSKAAAIAAADAQTEFNKKRIEIDVVIANEQAIRESLAAASAGRNIQADRASTGGDALLALRTKSADILARETQLTAELAAIKETEGAESTAYSLKSNELQTVKNEKLNNELDIQKAILANGQRSAAVLASLGREEAGLLAEKRALQESLNALRDQEPTDLGISEAEYQVQLEENKVALYLKQLEINQKLVESARTLGGDTAAAFSQLNTALQTGTGAGGILSADSTASLGEKVGYVRESMSGLISDMSKLGPEGELAAAVTQGALTMTEAFATGFEQIANEGSKLQATLAMAGAAISAISQIQQAASNAAVAAIDREIDAEKRRDGKSKESVAKIAALEKKKEAQKRKAFEMNKKMQMAQVAIAVASSIASNVAAASAAAAVTGGNPGVFAGVLGMMNAVTLGLGALQLAIIAGTSYQGGGGAPSAGGAATSISIGQRGSSVDMAKSQSSSGELSYLRGESGQGGAENFKPSGAFYGRKMRAMGGETAGYIVGEQGPELFMPDRPGRVVPSDDTQNMGGVSNVNFSINAVDAEGVEEVLIRQRGNIIGMLRDAANSYGQPFMEGVDTTVYTPTQAIRTYKR